MDQSVPDSRVYSVKAAFDGVIEFATPVSFTYLIFWWSFRTLLYSKVYVHFDAKGISQEMYRAAVRDGVRIDWQCPRCVDVHSDSFSENTRVETQESFFEVHELQPIGHVQSNSWEHQTRNGWLIPRRIRYVAFESLPSLKLLYSPTSIKRPPSGLWKVAA